MPSANVLEQKKVVVAGLTERLNNSIAGVIVDYKGINVADDTALRKELREAGVEYTVVKNTLLGFAAKEAGLDDLCNVLEGTTAIAISPEDHTAADGQSGDLAEIVPHGMLRCVAAQKLAHEDTHNAAHGQENHAG